jgi:hypothetical protein
MTTVPTVEPVTVKLYFAAQEAALVERILAKGFTARDNQTVKLPYGDPAFVDQLGIIVSSELDPTTGFAVEIELAANTTFLRRRELISHVAGVRYYVLYDCWKWARLRAVTLDELETACAKGFERWFSVPIVWFGKE